MSTSVAVTAARPLVDRSAKAFDARKEDVEVLRMKFNRFAPKNKMYNSHDFTAKVIEAGLKYYNNQATRYLEAAFTAELNANPNDAQKIMARYGIGLTNHSEELK